VRLHDLGPVDQAAPGEGDEVVLLLAPAGQRGGPLLRPAQLVHVAAALDHRAVDEPRGDRRQLAGRDRHHRLVEQREPRLDLAATEAYAALLVDRDRQQVGVAEALAGLHRRRELHLVAALERGEQREIAALDAVAVAEQPLRAAEPAGGAAQLAPQRELEADPEGAANRGLDRVRLEVRLVGTLEHRHVLRLVAEHVGRRRQPLEVAGGKGPGRQRSVSVLPRAPREGLASLPELVAGNHRVLTTRLTLADQLDSAQQATGSSPGGTQ
jgi:hypothetical protein